LLLRRRLPRSIWALGFVSLCMYISLEIIHSLLPVFLVTVLGASTVTVGLIESIGEFTASISKLFSGWLSDRLGKRKALTVIGYGLGALSKPLFALAPTSSWVLAARFRIVSARTFEARRTMRWLAILRPTECAVQPIAFDIRSIPSAPLPVLYLPWH
jgi:MFS family permease